MIKFYVKNFKICKWCANTRMLGIARHVSCSKFQQISPQIMALSRVKFGGGFTLIGNFYGTAYYNCLCVYCV
jgi:hypothetical protein